VRKFKTRVNQQIADEASAWWVDFSEGDVDAEGRVAFNRWLKTSPEHVRAYLEVSALWEDSSHLEGPDAQALLAAPPPPEDIVPRLRVGAERLGANGLRRARPFATGWFMGIAATAVVLAGGGWVVFNKHNFYATERGEQRTVQLQDGSVVELDTASRLRVNFTRDTRDVVLLSGQALFHVAPDPNRPFVVDCDGSKVRAVGTQFDVYKKGGGATVTVIEGKVAVSRASQSQQVASEPTLLAAGEQASISPGAVTRVVPSSTSLAAASAWTERRLVFESEGLEQVVAEFNRYNARTLVIKDPTLRAFHVSGDFSAFDSGQLLEFLTHRFAVKVVRTEDEIQIIAK
jgi:transmembrane sensor